jgi:peptide/nickel transport system permease protein
LLLAPAAALLSTLIAGLLGGFAGLRGGWIEKLILACADLAVALPLLFVLVALRALLPLDVPPMVSVVATFVTLGLLGWPSSLRVVWAAARRVRQSDHFLFATALGYDKTRLLLREVLPNLRPILLAQFWISIPVFILTEATLSMLGLGVMEPLPSWGNLLRGSEDFAFMLANPWRMAPLLALIVTVICFQHILPRTGEIG